MSVILETKNLTKKFPNKLAVDHINMHIEKGDIYGFIGKNGAGKTTAMKLILGLLNVTEGEIQLFEGENLNEARHRIGSLVEAPGFYRSCSAFENMKRFAIFTDTSDDEIKEILDLVGLSDAGKRKAGQFSLGMKQRLGIAIALLGNPEFMILDEPINGLDPTGIKDIRDTILRLNKEKGVTFLISSHLLDELAKITTKYGIINSGVLVEEISAKDLMEKCKTSIKVTVDDIEKAKDVLKDILSKEPHDIEENIIHLYNADLNPADINSILVLGGVKVSEIRTNENAFEEYFIQRLGD